MKRIFVFGNPLMEEDSIALKVAEQLKKKKQFKDFEFEQIESLNDLEKIPKELVILDCAEGIEKIEVIKHLKNLLGEKKFSLHDFDLGTELLLFEKIGKLRGKNLRIIAIPKEMPLKKAVKGVQETLQKLVISKRTAEILLQKGFILER